MDISRRKLLNWGAWGAVALAVAPTLACGSDSSRPNSQQTDQNDTETDDDKPKQADADYATRQAFLYCQSIRNTDGNGYDSRLELLDKDSVPLTPSGVSVNDTYEVAMSVDRFVQDYFNPETGADPAVKPMLQSAMIDVFRAKYPLKPESSLRTTIDDMYRALSADRSAEVLGGRSQSFAFDEEHEIVFGYLQDNENVAYMAIPIRDNNGNKELWLFTEGMNAQGVNRAYDSKLHDAVKSIIDSERVMGD